MTTIVFGVVMAFVVVFIGLSIRIVQQGQAMIIERLGRYSGILKPGINFIVPFVDIPRSVIWKTPIVYKGATYLQPSIINKLDLRETVYDFPRQNVITKDNVTIEINAMVYFQIMDPYRAVYEIANLPDAIEKLTQTSLRNIIGDLELDQTLVSRDIINTKLQTVLDEASDKWGVKVNRVELQDITPPADIRAAMEKQMRAEREKRELILRAEGEKQSSVLAAEGNKLAAINEAEGKKQAAILAAEGEAEARIRIAEAEKQSINRVTDALHENPSHYLVAMKYVEALAAIASGTDNRLVFMPYEASSVIGSLGGIQELLSSLSKNKTP